LREYTIGLREFVPEDHLVRLLFGDVADQMAYEAANLGSDDPFLLKSPDGGVWRTRIEERLATRALPGRGPYSIEATYRLGDTETLSEPTPRLDGS